MSLLDQQRFKVTLLTPVHIGSGETLGSHLILQDPDRDRRRSQTFILDMDALLSQVTDEQADKITEILISGRSSDLLDSLRREKMKLDQVSLYTLQRGFPARDLRLQIRRSDGIPIIPGSSLKGALRTLVLTGMTVDSAGKLNDIGNTALEAARNGFSGSRQQPKPEWAAQPLEEVVFRPASRDAHSDLLRCLHTRDVTFSPKDLEISFVKIHSPSKTDLSRLKPIPTKNPEMRSDRPIVIGVETLKAGISSQAEITSDSRLSKGQWAEKLNFANRAFTWEDLSRWSHINAQRFLEKEKKRAEQSGLQGLPEELGKLQSRIQQTIGGKAIALRLGWGIGWEGTTGGIADAGYRRGLLKTFKKMGHDPNAYDEKIPYKV